jgi:hypothetical protein
MTFQAWYVAAALNVLVTGLAGIAALRIPDTFLAGLLGLFLLWVLEGIYAAARSSPAKRKPAPCPCPGRVG